MLVSYRWGQPGEGELAASAVVVCSIQVTIAMRLVGSKAARVDSYEISLRLVGCVEATTTSSP